MIFLFSSFYSYCSSYNCSSYFSTCTCSCSFFLLLFFFFVLKDENNCICHESKSHIHNDTWVDLTYHGDVQQLVDDGFKGVKLDSCGLHSNVSYYSELINKTGVPMMIENCHQGTVCVVFENE